MTELSDAVAKAEAAADDRFTKIEATQAEQGRILSDQAGEIEDLWAAVKALGNGGGTEPVPPDPAPVTARLDLAVGPVIFPNQKMGQYIKDNWFATAARIAWHPTSLSGVGTEADVYARVEELTGLGMIALSNWHAVGYDATRNAGEGTAMDAYHGRLLERYKGNPLLAFDTGEYGQNNAQELVGGKWQVNKTYGDAYVNFMRARIGYLNDRGATQPVCISSLYWANDVMRTTGYGNITNQPLEELSSILVFGPRIQQGFDNVWFTVHPYDTWSGIAFTFEEFLTKAKAAGLKICVTETGMFNGNPPRDCRPGQRKVFNALRNGWNAGVFGWHASALDVNDFTAPDKGMTIDYVNGQPSNLTEQGRLFMERAQAVAKMS